MRRSIAILLVALLAAPGTWWRSPLPDTTELPASGRWSLVFEPLSVRTREVGEARIAGAWTLNSDYPGLGGYSALVLLDGGRLLAASDTGRMLQFAPPGSPPAELVLNDFARRRQPNKLLVDIEGMTRDPRSGRIWVAYEGHNAIERLEPGLTAPKRVSPPKMRSWPSNTGPETLLRLTDGRFLVVSESAGGWFGSGRHAALLFPGDPVEGAEPLEFAFEAEDGFRPVDATQLLDGRVAVLLRRFDWFLPEFNTRIVIADPREIREGEVWSGRQIAAIDRTGPSENYEGIAAESLAGGRVRLWLISDDNRSAIQHTQLLELHWHPERKRPRGSPARPLS